MDKAAVVIFHGFGDRAPHIFKIYLQSNQFAICAIIDE